MNQVTATFGDGRTSVYDVSFETSDTSQNVYITGETHYGTQNITYSLEQDSYGNIVHASTSYEFVGDPATQSQESCDLVYSESGYIKEIRYDIDGEYEVLTFDANNPDMYSVTTSSDVGGLINFSPIEGNSMWEKVDAVPYSDEDETKGVILCLCHGNRNRILAFYGLSDYAASFTDLPLYEETDPFGIRKYLDIENYEISGEWMKVSFDNAANITKLITKSGSKKQETTWTYEKIF